jgi:hypothetical protein
MSIIPLHLKDGFSGEVVIPDASEGGTKARAYLRSARLVGANGDAELGERNGSAFLSFPVSDGSLTFEATNAKLHRGGHVQSFPYRDKEAVARLTEQLAGDAVYAESSARFLRLAIDRLAELEEGGKVAGTHLAGLRGDPNKPGSAAWGGIDVFSFVDCLDDCRAEDHWLATCLVICAAKAATGGGKIFPEK